MEQNDFPKLIEILKHNWIIPDENVVKVMLTAVVAHYFSSDPLWIFLIAPPSSLKTELIASLDSYEGIYQISSLTPQTLFSGMKQAKDQSQSNSVLMRMGNKILTLKDFTTVLSMRWEDRAVVLGQLREVYDGKYKAKYGNGVEISWEGRIGMISGVTPAIDTHYAVFQTLGERFVQYRLEAIPEEQLTEVSIDVLGNEGVNRHEARDAMKDFITHLILRIPSIKDIEIPLEIKKSLGILASMVVRARSGTVRDSYKKTLEYIPEPEAPARLVKQLAVMCCALAVIDNRTEVSMDDYLITLKVGLDCIPRQRIKVLNFLCSTNEKLSTTQVGEGIDYSTNGANIHLEDLVAHKLLKVDRGGSGTANLWYLSERTQDYLKQLIPPSVTQEQKQEFFDRNKDYHNIISRMYGWETETEQVVRLQNDLFDSI